MARKKNRAPSTVWSVPVKFPAPMRKAVHAAAEAEGISPAQWVADRAIEAICGQKDAVPANPTLESGVGGTGENSDHVHVRTTRDLEPETQETYFPELSNAGIMKELEQTIVQLQQDFRYPMSPRGDQMDMRFMGPWIAYHLARCGWRQIPNRRLIKARPAREIPPGCYEDLVEWTSVDAPDEMDPSKLTLEQIKEAPPSVQAQAIRTMGGHAGPILNNGRDPDDQIWKQGIHIEAEDDPEVKDKLMERGVI